LSSIPKYYAKMTIDKKNYLALKQQFRGGKNDSGSFFKKIPEAGQNDPTRSCMIHNKKSTILKGL